MCNIVMSRKRETDDSMKQVYLKRASMLLIGLSEAGEPLAMFLYSLASLLQCPPRNRKDAMEDMIEAAKHGVSAASYEIWATPFPNCNPAEFRCLAETRFHYRMLYTSLSISVREYGRVITGKEDIIRAALLYSLAKPNHNDRIFAIDVLGRASFDVVYRTIIKEVIRVKHGFLLTPDESDLRLESYVVAEYLLRKDEKSAKLIDERLIIFSDEIRNYGRSRAKYFATYEQFQKRAFNK
jgi:hypothetical protein